MSRHQPRRARFGDDYTLRPNVVRRAVNVFVAVLSIDEHRATECVVRGRLVLDRGRVKHNLAALHSTTRSARRTP